jgi:subtilisin family serine protease
VFQTALAGLASFGISLLAARAASLRPAGASSIDPSIFAAVREGEPASFLVVLREQADLSGAAAIRDPAEKRRFVFEALNEVARRTQAPLAARLREAGATFGSHYLVNMLEVEGDRALAAEISRRPEVTRIAANRPAPLRRVPQAEPADALSAVESAPLAGEAVGPNLANIRVPEVWAEGFTGQGIVVGDADTGFAWEHPALKSHYRGFDGLGVTHDYNWHDAVHDAAPGNPCGSDSAAPCDDSGHGTSTAGIAVGGDGAGNQIGVAPGASLIGCRNMDQGNGTPARYTECFEFFLAPTDAAGRFPRPDLGADVINNSWGCPATEGCTDPEILRMVVENVRAAGIFVVVSAGNGGSQCDTVLDAPAIYEASFSIGATNDFDGIASFSSRGPVTQDGSNRLKPDIVAPGVAVRTAARPSGFTANFSGTSASAPHVAGAVALLWSAAPALRGDVAESEQILRLSATPLESAQDCPPYPGARVPNAVFGYGRLDVAAAVALAGPVPPQRVVRTPREHPGRTRVIPPRTP